MSPGEARSCGVLFHGYGFCCGMRSVCDTAAAAAAVEATIYFWHVTLELMAGAAPHSGDSAGAWLDLFVRPPPLNEHTRVLMMDILRV